MAGHRVRTDHSGVHLEHVGLPPFPLRNILLIVFLLLFTGVVTGLAIQGLVPKLSDDWYLRFDWWWRIILYMMIFVGPVVLISGFVLLSVAPSFAFIKRASWSDGAFRCTRSTLLGLRNSSSNCQLKHIDEIIAYLGPEHGREIEFGLMAGGVSMDLAITDVDLRSEALDVFFAIARQCGLNYYSIDDNDVDVMTVRAVAVEAGNVIPIPKATGTANYDRDEVETEIAIPQPSVAAFDPDDYGRFEHSLAEWQPSRRVRFHRPALSAFESSVYGCLPAIMVGILSFGVSKYIPDSSRLVIALGGAVLGFIGGIVVLRIRKPEVELTIDKAANTVRSRSGWRTQARPLTEVKRVVLKGSKQSVHRKNQSSYTVYRCRLFLEFDGGQEVLATENADWERSSDSQRLELESLAASLAAEIGVPWRWLGYQSPTVSRVFDNIVQYAMLLGLIALMGFFAWGVTMQGMSRAAWDAVADELEADGAAVTRAGIHLGHVPIFGDGLLVELKNPQFNDADLADVLATLEPIPLYGLDLSNTSVTDEGLKNFLNRPSLYFVNLSSTKISENAPNILAKTNLQSIDFRGTPVRMTHLKSFSGVHALTVLHLDEPNITDDGIALLGTIPRLKAVLVNDEDTTQRVLRRLAQLRGDTALRAAGDIRFVLD